MGRRGGVLAKNTDKTMKKIFGLGLAALMLALPGCVQDPTNDEGIAGGGTESITVNVTVESPVNADGTRITLGGESGNAFVWEAGDKIVAVGSADSNVTYTLTEGVDDAIIGQRLDAGATLTFTGFAEGETLVFAYLLGEGHVNSAKGSKVEFRLGSNKSGANSNGTANANIRSWTAASIEELVGKLIYVGTPDENGTLLLRNTMGIAEIQLKGSGGAIWAISLASRDYTLRSNYGYIDYTSDEPKFAVYDSYWDSTVNAQAGYAMYAGPSDPYLYLTEGEVFKFYIAMPLQHGKSYNDMSHSVGDLALLIRYEQTKGEFDNLTHCIISKKAHTFKRNVVQPFATIDLTKLTVEGDNTIDLTARDGLSNCYMVRPSESDQRYAISAQMLKDDTAWGGSYAVFPVWATQDGLIKDICYDKEAMKIYFTVVGGKGNGSTILGLGRNNQMFTECTRSWHIWITDAEEISYGSPAVTMLDRNLGAEWAPKSESEVIAMTGEQAASSCGFYYQWGNCKPFPGPINLDGSLNTPAGFESSNSFVGNTKQVTYSYIYNTQFFNNFKVSSAGYNIDNDSKYPVSMGHGTVETTYYSWASDLNDPRGGSDATWAYGKKGANDPCPAGYRVATHDELIKQFRYPVSGNNTHLIYRHYDVDNGKWISAAKYVDDQSDVNFAKEFGGYVESEEQFVWVPNAGYRLGNAVALSGVSRGEANGYAGRLYRAGYATNGANASNCALLWGVPSADFEYQNEANFGAGKTNVVSLKYEQVEDFGDGRYPISPIVMMNQCGNMYEPTHTISLDSALPVRCVKITSGVSVAPIEGTTTDTNVWN